MSVLVAAVVGSAAVGLYSANQGRQSARGAAAAQTQANDAALAQNQTQFEASMQAENARFGASQALQRQIANMNIGEQRAQFAAVQQVLAPYITAGNQALQDLKPYQQAGQDALTGQRDLIGLNGAKGQQAAIDGLANGVEMQVYAQQGENAMLQNASATGGLRGGNTQAAMAQFRPQMLAGLIGQQYERLGGLTALGANTTGMIFQTGQSAAAGQANAGMQVAGNIGSALNNYAGNVSSAFGQYGANVAGINQSNSDAFNDYYSNQGSIAGGLSIANGNANIAQANAIGGALGSYATMQMMRPSSGSTASSLNGMGQVNYGLASGNGGTGFKAF